MYPLNFGLPWQRRNLRLFLVIIFEKSWILQINFYAISVQRIPESNSNLCAHTTKDLCYQNKWNVPNLIKWRVPKSLLFKSSTDFDGTKKVPVEPKKTLIAVFVVLVEANCSYQSLCWRIFLSNIKNVLLFCANEASDQTCACSKKTCAANVMC